jgi:hypothetical protein
MSKCKLIGHDDMDINSFCQAAVCKAPSRFICIKCFTDGVHSTHSGNK